MQPDGQGQKIAFNESDAKAILPEPQSVKNAISYQRLVTMSRSTPHNSRRLGFALLALAALCFTGCTTLQLPDFPNRSVEQQPHKAFQDGLAIGARPITDKNESKEYFGVDLLAADILAVAVTVENRSTDSGFILEKERFRLGDVAVGAGRSKGKLGDETAALALGTAGVALLSPMLIPLSAKMGSDARIIRHNFVTKELQATTINPGRAVQGFLYFPLPNQAASDNDFILHLEALELRTRQYKSVEIPLHLERK